jgi:hypothetical protein
MAALMTTAGLLAFLTAGSFVAALFLLGDQVNNAYRVVE